ncbi:transposase-like protein DUF772 [Streptomyces sp. 3212.3]|nr:transposase-like protein DUF772 [Streptomyces sp. 3212.3]
MSMPSGSDEVPAETMRVARAAFPKGSLAIRMRDELGVLFSDEQFAGLLPARGKRAWSPGRLVMVLVLQFVEGLTDRQAAEAVRARIDWKFALGSDRRGRHALLRMIWADDAPPALRELPEAGTLRQVWVQPFHLVEGEVQRRDPKDRPPGAMRLVTLHDAEARSGGKRDIYWDGSAPRRRRAPSSVGSCGLVDQRPDGRATRAGGSCRSVPGHEGDWLQAEQRSGSLSQ